MGQVSCKMCAHPGYATPHRYDSHPLPASQSSLPTHHVNPFMRHKVVWAWVESSHSPSFHRLQSGPGSFLLHGPPRTGPPILMQPWLLWVRPETPQAIKMSKHWPNFLQTDINRLTHIRAHHTPPAPGSQAPSGTSALRRPTAPRWRGSGAGEGGHTLAQLPRALGSVRLMMPAFTLG